MFPFEVSAEVIAIFIPIIVVLGVFAAVITSIVVSGKHKELAHRERIIAMEKGIPVPEMPKIEKRPMHLTMRAWGLIFMMLGVALIIAIWVTAGVKAGIWGLLPVAIGAAMLIAARREKDEPPAFRRERE
jgi:cadmium resistance protein CadD (predicted permease)